MAALLVAAVAHGRTDDANALISAIIKPGPEHYATAVSALTEWATASSGQPSGDGGQQARGSLGSAGAT